MAIAQLNKNDVEINFPLSEVSTSESSIPSSSSSMSLPQNEIFELKKHAETTLGMMKSYFDNQRLTDVTLVAGDKRISAHRLILSARSEYFATMFISEMKESTQDEIELKTVDGEALYCLVQFCYTGCIELHEDSIEMLLVTAHLLQVSPVIEACCQFLIRQLHPSNCLGIKRLADIYECLKLSSFAERYAFKNFVQVVENEEFLSLSADELVKFLKAEDVIVPSEEIIYNALVKWLQHDVENRSKHAINFLNYVKLPLLSPTVCPKSNSTVFNPGPKFIVDHIHSNELFKDQKPVQDLITKVLIHHLVPERSSLSQSNYTKPRKTNEMLLVISSKSVTDIPGNIDALSIKNNSWKHMMNMNDCRRGFNAIILENHLLVVGGVNKHGTTNSVKCFNFFTRSWNSLASMNVRRRNLGVAVVKGFLYAVGGENKEGILESAEKWDPVIHQWKFLAPMLTKRTNFGVAELNNKLYAVGGWSGHKVLKTVECYDPNTNKWTLCAPMSEHRRMISVAVLNGYLYVLGGWDDTRQNLDSVERYDPTTDTWIAVAPMSMKRHHVGACAFDNYLFAVGGKYDYESLDLVEAYNPVSNEWQKLSPLITDKGECVCVVVKHPVVKCPFFK